MSDTKVIVYERTSKKDKHPELQDADNKVFCDSKGFTNVEVVEEKGSSYVKRDKREKWPVVVQRLKDKENKEAKALVLWRYDRAFRNAKEFVKFMKEMYLFYGVKVYSVQETWVSDLWETTEKMKVEIPEPWGNVISGIMKEVWVGMLQIVGKAAEDESTKRSQRTKLAVVMDNGITKSYKGKKWGRVSLDGEVVKQVLELNNQGKSIREISQAVYYYDRSRNKHFVSKSAVHNILTKHDKGAS